MFRKIAIAALCFVLTVSLLTACRSGSSTDETATSSTATEPTTRPTTAPTTAPTTRPSGSSGMQDGVIDGQGDAASKSGRVQRRP